MIVIVPMMTMTSNIMTANETSGNRKKTCKSENKTKKRERSVRNVQAVKNSKNNRVELRCSSVGGAVTYPDKTGEETYYLEKSTYYRDIPDPDLDPAVAVACLDDRYEEKTESKKMKISWKESSECR